MALKKSKSVQNSTQLAEYWAFGPLSINPFAEKATVQLGLFWDEAAYTLDKTAVLELSEPFRITGEDYRAIFPEGIPLEEMPNLPEIILNIFLYIKNSTDELDQPSWFSDAEIVP